MKSHPTCHGELCESHPLQQRAQQLAGRVFEAEEQRDSFAVVKLRQAAVLLPQVFVPHLRHKRSQFLRTQMRQQVTQQHRKGVLQINKIIRTESYLISKATVVHGGQAVVDGCGSVLVQRLPGRLGLQVAVFQGLHHGIGHLPFNLYNQNTKTQLLKWRKRNVVGASWALNMCT